MDTVGEMSERFEMDVHAYVLMDNHYHLLVRTREANLKKAMHWFGTTYTQRYTRMADNPELVKKFEQLNSQFKL